MNPFFIADDQPWEDLGDGISRKIVGYTDDLMAVHVRFEKGAVGAVHSHEIHDQIGYVVCGSSKLKSKVKRRFLRQEMLTLHPNTSNMVRLP